MDRCLDPAEAPVTGICHRRRPIHTVMQSDRNSSKTNTFHEPITYEPHVKDESEQIVTFARQEYGRVEVFRIKMRSLVQKL